MIETKTTTVRGRNVFCSRGEGVWTLALLENGGPIICDKDFDKAVERFELGLDVCLCVELMMMHNRMSDAGASGEEIETAWKDKMN